MQFSAQIKLKLHLNTFNYIIDGNWLKDLENPDDQNKSV